MNIIRPTLRQLEYQEWELGVFLHFGIRTFYEGHRDWDGKPMEASGFCPSALDCNDWARSAAEAGARYMVLTAKHHEGFANWPSRFTDFSVSSSPWKNGKGDVVAEYVAACRKAGLKVGLYYSPADVSCPVYADASAYDNYFINQISELLDGRYGEIDMLWFDGCGSENHTYDWARIMPEIRRMQPRILIFNMGDPDYRWVGNEAGLAPSPCFNLSKAVNLSVMTDELEQVQGAEAWLPAECDFMIRDHNWFYSDEDAHTVKQPDELLGIYHYSVGRGANMLVNIGPDRRGLFPDPDRESLIAFGREVKRRYSSPLALLNEFTREGFVWSLQRDEPFLLDTVILKEAIELGESVKRFRIEIDTYKGGCPITIYEGTSIGHKAIATFPLVRARGIRVEVVTSGEAVELKDLSLHCASRRGR